MTKFVFYVRTQEGKIQRLGNMITDTSESILASYRYEEVLIDFPEPLVFWANGKGLSVGIAPLISSP